MAETTGAGSTAPRASYAGRVTRHVEHVLVVDVEAAGYTVRFVRELEWEVDPTAYVERPVGGLDYFDEVDGWRPIGTLPMQQESAARTAVRRWCAAHPLDLRDFS
jgi:hypothetical protein